MSTSTNRYTLLIPKSAYDQIVFQAQSALPNECCGLLAGHVAGPIARAVRCLPLVNAAINPAIEYLSESRSIISAHKAMRSTDLREVAVYHSHPTTDPVPSRKDRENNPYDDFLMHLILSLKNGQPLLRAWWITSDSFEEGRWEIGDDANHGLT
jgi:[CysO sulfur-carrier protein]-S-L-cysteine hydrolase